jgi:hypothetical protein
MISRTNIINDIFEIYNFNSYLEIGTRVPADNFDCINSKLKHSVDPNTDGRYYYTYNTTSDDFFQNYISQKYDVIFIDGMHTEEQVYKDVKNSIKNLNNNGFIVIHDCNPANKYYIIFLTNIILKKIITSCIICIIISTISIWINRMF